MMNLAYKKKLINEIIIKIERAFIIAFILMTICVRMIVKTDTLLLINNIFLILAGTIGWFFMVINKCQFEMLYAGFSAICWIIEIFMGRVWNYSLTDFFTSLLYMGIAYFIVANYCKWGLIKIIYIVASIVVIFQIVFLGRSYILIMIEGNSYNYISVVFLLLLGMIFITDKELRIIQIITYSILYFLICLLSYGRGGIVSGTLFIIGVLAVNMFHKKNKLQFLFTVLLILTIIIVAETFGQAIGNLIMEGNYFGKFNSYGFNSNGRLEIWGNYLSECFSSVDLFILGGDAFSFLSISGKELNLHNSFLQMYASYGVLYLVLNLVIVVNVIRKKIRERDMYVLVFIFAFMTRSFTDKIMFEWPCEIIYYYYIFEYLASKSYKRKLKNSMNSLNLNYSRRSI